MHSTQIYNSRHIHKDWVFSSSGSVGICSMYRWWTFVLVEGNTGSYRVSVERRKCSARIQTAGVARRVPWVNRQRSAQTVEKTGNTEHCGVVAEEFGGRSRVKCSSGSFVGFLLTSPFCSTVLKPHLHTQTPWHTASHRRLGTATALTGVRWEGGGNGWGVRTYREYSKKITTSGFMTALECTKFLRVSTASLAGVKGPYF